MNVSRVDGPAKIRGWAQYTADVEMPGMVYAKVLRSTYPHAGWCVSMRVRRRSCRGWWRC